MSETKRADDVAALSLLEEPTRRRLYDWVVSQARPVGREEAAKAVEITRPLATFHLDRLAEAGLLEAGYRRLTGRVGPGAGRPARIYWRAARDFSVSLPDRRYERAAQLFASAIEDLPGESFPATLQDAARHLGQKLGADSRRGSPTKRLTAALEEGGYEPVSDRTGTIRLRNCPFDALVESHRTVVCGTNLAMAEGIASGIGITGVRPVLDPRPGHCCVAYVPDAQVRDDSVTSATQNQASGA